MTENENLCRVVCRNASRRGWRLELGECSRAIWKRDAEMWQLPLSFDTRNRRQLLTQACAGLLTKHPELYP